MCHSAIIGSVKAFGNDLDILQYNWYPVGWLVGVLSEKPNEALSFGQGNTASVLSVGPTAANLQPSAALSHNHRRVAVRLISAGRLIRQILSGPQTTTAFSCFFCYWLCIYITCAAHEFLLAARVYTGVFEYSLWPFFAREWLEWFGSICD